jgi:hypothetical protein
VAALSTQNFTSTTDSYNTAVGYAAGGVVTTGVGNTLMGGLAGDALTDADHNVAVGLQALTTDTLGSRSTAIGRSALGAQNFTSATDTYNVAVGYDAGVQITTGIRNTLVGGASGDSITDADYNVAIGMNTLSANTVGSRNTAVGYTALSAVNPASATDTYNTAVGYVAGNAVSTGVRNTFVGGLAGDSTDDGNDNVAFGYSALSANCTNANTAIGRSAGSGVTSGSNTLIGAEAGHNTVVLAGGANNTLVGAYCRSDAVDSDYAMGLGYNLSCSSDYTTLGNGGSDIRAAHGNVTWATVSDERYKKDITDSTAGLSFINALRPRTFKYKKLGELPEDFNAYEADSTDVFKNSNTNHGFIAQEVKAAIDADSSIKDGFRLWDDRPDGSQEVAEAALIPVLVKAIQEQNDLIESLTARITALES